ncbi:hypothetical protein [Ruegeria arenilitoris]|uniref:hypothetical protein n=1 Tax=Ruegeria arenilitoris TaxID=1173585 RepID=UPI001C2C1FBC|nr:hypothetical protein [Ruegeria arenilitoris]
MAFGYVAAFMTYLAAQNFVVSARLILIVLAALLVQLLAAAGVFIGPVADTIAYVETANSCQFSLSLCGDRIHTYVLGSMSTVLGPLWPVLFGWLAFKLHKQCFDMAGMFRKNIFFVIALTYTAYQTASGMGEWTYCILAIYIAFISMNPPSFLRSPAKSVRSSVLAVAAFFTLVLAHPGNLFVASIFLRNLKLVLIAFLSAALLFFVYWDLFAASVSKAYIFSGPDAALSAVESKLRIATERGDTSYAGWLFYVGFPYHPTGVALSILQFTFPFFAPNTGAISLAIGAISALFSVLCVFLCWKLRLAPLFVAISAILICHIVFGISSYTPGVGLRHKVPLFVYLLAVRYYAQRPMPDRKTSRILHPNHLGKFGT